jgi:hypothetical protein
MNDSNDFYYRFEGRCGCLLSFAQSRMPKPSRFTIHVREIRKLTEQVTPNGSRLVLHMQGEAAPFVEGISYNELRSHMEAAWVSHIAGGLPQGADLASQQWEGQANAE